jgi:thiamine biosynthesis lipoprotein
LLLINLFSSPITLADPVEKPSEPTRHTFASPHLGTVVRVIFYSIEDESSAKEQADGCFELVRKLDAVFSDYREDSELNVLCRNPIKEPHRVSKELFEVIAYAQEVSARSNGAFDITLGKDTKRWRAKRDGATEGEPSKEPATTTSYRDLVLDPKKQTITLLKPLQLDLGGIAKGYIADRLMAKLKEEGITRAAVTVGGEIVLSEAPIGKKGWRIGLSDPRKKITGTLELTHTALSTSGDSYQFFENDGERQAHLIDPKSRKGKANRLNVTTIAPTAMAADAWATAFRILPTDKALPLSEKQEEIETFFNPLEGEPERTTGFPAFQPSK